MFKYNHIKKILYNKTILITGGTGSFGSKFLDKIVNLNCKIVIFSRDELKQHEQRLKYNNKKIQYIVGDIRDSKSIYDAMKGVDYVFHAAALKQVPSCEFFPEEAVKTNFLGSINVIEAAVEQKVKSVILLSTDKAVYPINAMGMSKALMEKVALSKARQIKNNKTSISIVRYGNVMLSRGSVIPLFINQIKNRKNITITNKYMTRFLMPLDKAIELVFIALKKNKNGSIYIHKANSANIKDLSEALKTIFKSNIKTKIIGNRLGEKLHEVLASKEELKRSRSFKEHIEIRMQDTELNYEKYYTKGQNSKEIEDYASNLSNQISFRKLITTLSKEINKKI